MRALAIAATGMNAQQLNVDSTAKGVVMTDIAPNSPAATASEMSQRAGRRRLFSVSKVLETASIAIIAVPASWLDPVKAPHSPRSP